MGQIADDMINGFMCSHCGTCFEKEHGYPVLCADCHKEQAKSDVPNDQRIPKAMHREL